jgi:hypothetical protein
MPGWLLAEDGDEVDRWIARLVNPLRTLTPQEGLQIAALVRQLLGDAGK